LSTTSIYKAKQNQHEENQGVHNERIYIRDIEAPKLCRIQRILGVTLWNLMLDVLEKIAEAFMADFLRAGGNGRS